MAEYIQISHTHLFLFDTHFTISTYMKGSSVRFLSWCSWKEERKVHVPGIRESWAPFAPCPASAVTTGWTLNPSVPSSLF